ncbi:DUF1214 domain-containing protein [Methyloligella sp. 2.7D]|uniref:DUF1214 domain-containing protein n=1 Tax=unclassified Methyloligella TaxID=2625955 RepID=UPI00157D860F|nr:DUF1214 domain-containing protein [Methyloligella sp. GL2]QKP77100.1 DUF1214 domain-containing protein [Methyloligella sp. GL2]
MLLGIAAFLVALALGIGSALLVIRHGVPYATEHAGPWMSWPSEGHPDADLYTRAYLAKSGRLPVTSTTVRYFSADADNQGSPLTSDCEYLLVGQPLQARWWSLALYDGEGRPIANPSDRYSFNSEEVLRRTDGSYRMILAQNARPENWLPTGADPGRDLTLLLRIYEPTETDERGIGAIDTERLPTIERTVCR